MRYPLMNQRLICIILSLLIAGSGNAADRKKRVTANAGTGPYSFGPQTGLLRMSGVQRGFTDTVAAIKHNKSSEIIRALIELKTETEKIPGLQDIAVRIGGLIPAAPYLSLDYVSLSSIEIEKVNQLLKDAQIRLQSEIDAEERPKSMGSLNSGFFLHESSAYEFNSLIVSSDENGSPHNGAASYFTAGSYVPLTGSKARMTWRLGAGVAFGDPYRTVGSLSAASFLSPGALDVAGTISSLIKPGEPLPRVKFTRSLVDHIRPGDVWLTLSLRQISRTTARRVLANGTMGEAELTFALDRFYHGTYNATTITLSGIYSANNDLGVDELGIDFRTPVASHSFLCGRYGTRGHYTLSLEMKL